MPVMPHDIGTVIKIALLILSLGLDTFTVAVALGIAGIGFGSRLRVAASFAVFEGGMPLVGFVAGRVLSNAVGEVASAIGILVLFGAGGWMVYESLSSGEEMNVEIANWRSLIATSIAVSLDELAIGFSMGALGLPIGITVALIATQAFTLTLLGTAIGHRVGEELAERAETVAGLVLWGLALVLTLEKIGHR